MGYAASEITQVRLVIEKELTHCYVHVNAIGDCPIGIQGWHFKTFPASVSAVDILNDFQEHLSWPQAAPP